MFDYGTFLGGMIIGKVGDIYKMRSVFIFPSLLVGCGFMVVVKYSLVDTVWLYYLVIFGIGVT
jgi:OPA family glycerol-3-phosphate transporter-like MFS transporter 3